MLPKDTRRDSWSYQDCLPARVRRRCWVDAEWRSEVGSRGLSKRHSRFVHATCMKWISNTVCNVQHIYMQGRAECQCKFKFWTSRASRLSRPRSCFISPAAWLLPRAESGTSGCEDKTACTLAAQTVDSAPYRICRKGAHQSVEKVD